MSLSPNFDQSKVNAQVNAEWLGRSLADLFAKFNKDIKLAAKGEDGQRAAIINFVSNGDLAVPLFSVICSSTDNNNISMKVAFADKAFPKRYELDVNFTYSHGRVDNRSLQISFIDSETKSEFKKEWVEKADVNAMLKVFGEINATFLMDRIELVGGYEAFPAINYFTYWDPAQANHPINLTANTKAKAQGA
jgi:hypothetical protein